MTERRLLAAMVALGLWAAAGPARAGEEQAAPETRSGAAEPLRNMAQLDLGLAVIGLGYERVVGARVAVQLEAQYFSTWFMDPELSGFGAQVRPSLFVTGEAPSGVYLAPYLRVDVVEGDIGNGYSWSLGGFVGYAHTFAERFSVRAGAGVQVLHYTLYPDGGGPSVSDERTLPALDLVLGWRY